MYQFIILRKAYQNLSSFVFCSYAPPQGLLLMCNLVDLRYFLNAVCVSVKFTLQSAFHCLLASITGVHDDYMQVG